MVVTAISDCYLLSYMTSDIWECSISDCSISDCSISDCSIRVFTSYTVNDESLEGLSSKEINLAEESLANFSTYTGSL